MIKYALVGAAGYIAPKHLKAIKETGGGLVMAADTHDSVGILDSYFPRCHYTWDWKELLRSGADTLVICTPNHLHYLMALLGLQSGMDVICEKPLVLSPDLAKMLVREEQDTGRRVYTVHQMRLLPAIADMPQGITKVHVHYHAPRGQWYDRSWKGNDYMSGGVLMNIGIHLFDLCLWKFGPAEKVIDHWMDHRNSRGTMRTREAVITWDLSTEMSGEGTLRVLRTDKGDIDFSGCGDLHTEVYREILRGRGIRAAETVPVLELIEHLGKTQ